MLRGAGRLAGPGKVEVDGEPYRTSHVVIATGSDPVFPPIPGLDELEGVWTNREVTALTEVPRRLLVMGGGPVGVEMAQAVSRLGASVALVEGMDHVLREPKPLGEALATALAADGIEVTSASTPAASAARRTGTWWTSTGATSCAASACWWRQACTCRWLRPRHGWRGAGPPGGSGRRADARDGRRVGDRRRDRHMAAHVHGQVPGPRGGDNILGRDRVATTTPSRGGLHRSASSGRRRAPRCAVGHGPLAEVRALHLHAGVCGAAGLHDAAIGRRAAHRRVCAGTRGRRVAPSRRRSRSGRVPLAVLFDVIQPFPSFSEAFLATLSDLEARTAGDARKDPTRGGQYEQHPVER